MVEQPIRNRQVESSTLSLGSIFQQVTNTHFPSLFFRANGFFHFLSLLQVRLQSGKRFRSERF